MGNQNDANRYKQNLSFRAVTLPGANFEKIRISVLRTLNVIVCGETHKSFSLLG